MIYKLLIDTESGAPYIDPINDKDLVKDLDLYLENKDLTFEETQILAVEYKKVVEYLCNGYLKRCVDEIKDSLNTLADIVRRIRYDNEHYEYYQCVDSEFYKYMDIDLKFDAALDTLRCYCDCYTETTVTWSKLTGQIVKVFGNACHPASIWIDACASKYMYSPNKKYVKLPELLQCISFRDLYIKEKEDNDDKCNNV